MSLSRIQRLIDTGRIDPKEPITMSVLWRSGAVRRIPDGVKLVCRVCLWVVIFASDLLGGTLCPFCSQLSALFCVALSNRATSFLTRRPLVLFSPLTATACRFFVFVFWQVGDSLPAPLDIRVSEASVEAAAAVLDTGGSLMLVYYNALGLRALLKPEKWAAVGKPLPRFVRYGG